MLHWSRRRGISRASYLARKARARRAGLVQLGAVRVARRPDPPHAYPENAQAAGNLIERRQGEEGAPLMLDAPEPLGAAIRATAEGESLALSAPGIGGVVLRYGQLYCPGTYFDSGGDFVRQARRLMIPIVGAGLGMFSFVHVDDAAAAAVCATTCGGGIYNIVDDDPAFTRDWIPAFCAEAHAPAPLHVPVWLASVLAGRLAALLAEARGASNARARRELEWQPSHRSWRQGFFDAADGSGHTRPRPSTGVEVGGRAHSVKDLALLTKDMKRMVSEQRLGHVATVCPDGTPNLSPKGTTLVWDDNTLVFVDLRSPQTLRNLASNPAIEINVIDPVVRKGYRFKGIATVERHGPAFEHGLSFFREKIGLSRERVRSIVFVRVTRAVPLLSPAYDSGEPDPKVVGFLNGRLTTRSL